MKKTLLIICLSILALLFCIGGALWIAPITIGTNSKKPTPNNKTALTISALPTINDFYYGEELEVNPGVVQIKENDYASGKWTIDFSSYVQTSGSGKQIPVSIDVTFTPNDSDLYEPFVTTISANILAVAEYNGMYYSTLDGALDAANNASNGGTVTALALGYELEKAGGLAEKAKTINISTIDSNVTLNIPWATKGETISEDTYKTATKTITDRTLYVHHNSTSNDFAYWKESTYLRNNVSIKTNKTLTNKGTITVGGIVSANRKNKKNIYYHYIQNCIA